MQYCLPNPGPCVAARQLQQEESSVRRVASHAILDLAEEGVSKQISLDNGSPDLCYSYGFICSQGNCSKMEDRVLVQDLSGNAFFPGCQRVVVMGVFDGHAGYEAAEHLSKHFLPALLQSSHLPTCEYGLALKHALMELEEEFMVHHYLSGTTALVGIMVDSMLYLANVGDCRAVVSDDAEARALTRDHNPKSNELERRRLEDAGAQLSTDGYVQLAVEGCECTDIALSRALGGAHIKKAGGMARSNSDTGAMLAALGNRPPMLQAWHSHDPAYMGNGHGYAHDALHANMSNGHGHGHIHPAHVPTPLLEESCPAVPAPPRPSLDCFPSLALASTASPPTASTNGGEGASSSTASALTSTATANSGIVIPDPEVFQYAIHQDSEFLVLASDGLWDEMRNNEVVSRVRRWLREGATSQEAAEKLVEWAIKLGSRDNVTAVVLRFSSRDLPGPALNNSVLRRVRSEAVFN